MELTHINKNGEAHMVDVGQKTKTERTAVAEACILMLPHTLDEISESNIKKGDVLGAARIAGIMAAKSTSSLIPLCHPIPITSAGVEITPVPPDRMRIIATVSCTHETGVEMEALTAASIAALTVYDMCKAIDKGMEITSIHLLKKTGGKSGDFFRASVPELKEIILRNDETFSIISEEALGKMKYIGFTGLCMKKFKADLVVSNLDLENLEIGSVLSIGEARLEMTAKKHCYPECVLLKTGTKCPLKTGCAFLRAVIPGRVTEGSKITAEKPVKE